MPPTIAAVDAVVLARAAIAAHLARYVQQAIAGCKKGNKSIFFVISCNQSLESSMAKPRPKYCEEIN